MQNKQQGNSSEKDRYHSCPLNLSPGGEVNTSLKEKKNVIPLISRMSWYKKHWIEMLEGAVDGWQCSEPTLGRGDAENVVWNPINNCWKESRHTGSWGKV